MFSISSRLFALGAVALLLAGCSEEEHDRREIVDSRKLFPDEEDPKLGVPTKERFMREQPKASNPFQYAAQAGWVEATPTQMRPLNFTFGESGEGECYLSAFQGSGGMARNVNRWYGQMSQDPLTEAQVAELPQKPLLGGMATFADIEGTFTAMSMTGTAEGKPDYRMLALIQESAGFTFTVKMTGPKDLVEAQAASFDNFCQSVSLKAHGAK